MTGRGSGFLCLFLLRKEPYFVSTKDRLSPRKRRSRKKVLFMKKKAISQKPAKVNDLKELVEQGARDFGDVPHYYHKENGTPVPYTRSQLLTAVNEIGTAFATLGIMGDNIAIIGDTHPYYMPTYYAAANGGGAAVPLDKELDDAAIAGFANIAKVSAIAYTESFNKRMPEIAKLLETVKYFIPFSPDAEFMPTENYISISDVTERGRKAMSEGNDEFLSFKPDREKMAALLFTSGTTGTSKGVMLSHKNLAAAANACVDCMAFDQNDTFVSVLPMNHSYETTTEHLAMYLLGCTTYINDSIKNVVRNFNRYKPNCLILVPLYVETMHKKIWKEIDKKGMRKKVERAIKLSNALRKIGIDLRAKLFKEVLDAFGGNLKTIVCGGAPLSKKLIEDFDAFGIEILEGFGITECSPLVAVNRTGKRKFGSVGPAVLGCEVKIDKDENEETGEILVKGDNVMLGYLDAPEATAEVFTDDGWFRTGDIGYMDSDGYVYITGRKKNLIILSNGKNIFPEEIEEHLSHNEIIAESVVIGRNNDLGEPVISAIVYPNQELCDGKTKEEIFDMVKAAVEITNKQLPTFKHIQNIEVRDTEFEKTTTRKIKRFLVK